MKITLEISEKDIQKMAIERMKKEIADELYDEFIYEEVDKALRRFIETEDCTAMIDEIVKTSQNELRKIAKYAISHRGYEF